MSDKLCHCNNLRIVAGLGSAEDPFKLEYAEDEIFESSAGSNHLDQASTDYFEPPTGVKLQLCQVSKSLDPNMVVPDQTECACHPIPTAVMSDDVPMVKEVVMRVSPQEVHELVNQEVEVVSGDSETSRELPPLYAMSSQCCTPTKGHIGSLHPKPYQQSNYFLGQRLGLQSTVDLCCNWLCAKRTGSISHSSRSAGYSRDVDHKDINSNGTFDEWDTDQSVDLGISLGDSGDV